MHLTNIRTGHAHSKQRKIMNPVFSVNHMRYMAPLFFDIGSKVRTTANLNRTSCFNLYMTASCAKL